jgi:WD40 repeat protein
MGQFTPNGQQLVSALRVNDPVVRWQDLPNGKVAAELKTIQLPISTMALTADGKTLIAVTNDGAFKVCKRDAPDEPRSFGDGVNTHAGLALSSDGRYVAAAVEGGKIKLWNVATGRAIRLFQGHSAPVRAVAYSPDQRFIASGSEDKTLRVWKLWDGDSLPPAPKPTASAPR